MTGASEVVLALDVGLKRTGVASGQRLTQSSNPVCTLAMNRGRLDTAEFDALIEAWQPQTIVIGDPKTDDPALNKAINRIKSHIQQTHKIAISMVDETLSSSHANHHISESGLQGKKREEVRDQVAACLILQSYFNLHTTA